MSDLETLKGPIYQFFVALPHASINSCKSSFQSLPSKLRDIYPRTYGSVFARKGAGLG